MRYMHPPIVENSLYPNCKKMKQCLFYNFRRYIPVFRYNVVKPGIFRGKAVHWLIAENPQSWL